MNISNQYNDECSSSGSRHSSVSFGPIQVREYERILTDGHRSVGLELGWSYEESDRIDLDHYENTVAKCIIGGPAPRTPEERVRILSKYGFSASELTRHEENRLARERTEIDVQPNENSSTEQEQRATKKSVWEGRKSIRNRFNMVLRRSS